MSAKKMTAAEISGERLRAALTIPRAFRNVVAELGLDYDLAEHRRAVDSALQRERRAGTVRLNDLRKWAKVET